MRLHDSLEAFLYATAADAGGVVIALDDLHAADDATLRLLAYIAPRLWRSSLLVIGTHRPLEPDASPRQRRWLEATARRGGATCLAGLDEPEVARLLKSVLRAPATAGLAREVCELTDGNPFLAMEAGRLFSQSGSVGASAVLPTEAGAVVRRRLAFLSDMTRSVLARAADLGRDLDVVTLIAVCGEDGGAVLDALGDATVLGLAIETGVGRWSFTHALVREALVEVLDAADQAEVHRRAVVAIEATHGIGAGAPLARLAHHADAAADRDKAVRYCTMAGQAALDALAFDEAAGWFGRALARLEEQDASDAHLRFEVLLALGEARARAGEFPEGRDACRRALAAARSLRSPELVARAALGMAPVPNSDKDPVRVAALEEALAGLPERDSALRARLLLALALSRRVSDADRYPERVVAPADQGVAMARRTGDNGTIRAALIDWHFVVFLTPETLETRLRVAAELVRMCQAAGDGERLVIARHWLAHDLFQAGDIDAVAAVLDAAEAEAAQLRLPFLQWGARFPRAALALLAGRVEEAERIAGEALGIGERSELYDVQMVWEEQLIEICYHQGRSPELLERVRRYLDRFPLLGAEGRGVFMLVALVSLGRLEDPPTQLSRAAECALAVVPAFGARVLASVAEACFQTGFAARAGELYEAMLPFAGEHVTTGVTSFSLGSSDRYLGHLATLLGHFEDADAHFGAAQRLHRRLGARIWATHTACDHARMLGARGHSGDAERAATLLEHARDEFAAMGMSLFEERASQALRELPSGPVPEWAALRRSGEIWSVTYAGTVVHVQDGKGARYLAHLLARPDEPVHAADLAGRPAAAGDRQATAAARHSVTRALRVTINHIGSANPILAAHLRSTIRTGTYCCYRPDPLSPIVWET